MKSKKVLSMLLAMILSTSSLTGCANVNTLTKLPLNNIQIVDKELNEKEEITLEENKQDETKVENQEETKVENQEETKEEKQETSKEQNTEVKEQKQETKEEVKVTFTEVNETVYAKTEVNVRTKPSASASKLGVLKESESIQRIGIGSNGWSKVVFNGKEGYINAAYLTKTKPTEETKKEETKQEETKKEETKKEEVKETVTFTEVDETVYATTDVNVRKEPSASATKLGTLKEGKSIQRIGIGSNGWDKVIFDGKEAYINGSYLTKTKPTTTNTSSYPITYKDSTATITIYKEWYKNAYVYAAHIQFSDYDRLATSCANGKYGNGTETTSHAAKRLGAILTINGCYSAKKLDYIVVRDGKIWNGGDRNTWLPAIYSQHTGKFLSAWETGGTKGIAGKNVKELVNAGLFTDSFCFGPPILSGGKITAGSDSSRAQRTFIGTNGKAGDIWLVVSDGRYNDGKSAGLTYKEMASYLKSKDCTFGIPLDGGGSTTMVFKGKVLNAAKGNERAVVDFVYFK